MQSFYADYLACCTYRENRFDDFFASFPLDAPLDQSVNHQLPTLANGNNDQSGPAGIRTRNQGIMSPLL